MGVFIVGNCSNRFGILSEIEENRRKKRLKKCGIISRWILIGLFRRVFVLALASPKIINKDKIKWKKRKRRS